MTLYLKFLHWKAYWLDVIELLVVVIMVEALNAVVECYHKMTIIQLGGQR